MGIPVSATRNNRSEPTRVLARHEGDERRVAADAQAGMFAADLFETEAMGGWWRAVCAS